MAKFAETCSGTGRQKHTEYDVDGTVIPDLTYDEPCDDCDGAGGWND